MRTSYRFLLTTLTVMALCTGKAHAQKAIILPEDYARITIQSLPEDAKVYCNGRLICTTTPATVDIPFRGVIAPGSKKDKDLRMRRSAEASRIELTFVKDGHVRGTEIIKPVITQIKKKEYQFKWPKTVIHEFAKAKGSTYGNEYKKDPTIVKGEAKTRVSRDKPGQSALERTIIRWYFDSAPKGARVFWRVVSSVPAEVKNTNELYLGTTPYEDTRSFNILGLTYENSRDVQIEVKLRRQGYMEQTKHFNVRQAIDQQEISSFFDLVKEE